MNRDVAADIKYVGVDDIDIQLFERQYPLPHGMSYNSYVIIDDKIAVMDSVEADHGEQWIRQVEEATGERTPDYLVVHHMEPDHSACLDHAVRQWPGIRIVATAKAVAMMKQFFPDGDVADHAVIVKEGDMLSLGRHTLRFYTAPMIHWPEVMVSYEEHDHVLFSADAFGKFGALQYEDEWVNEARRYYINIVGKYGNQVQALLKKLVEPPISVIAPLHGPVLRGNLSSYLKLYDCWSRYEPEAKGILIAYASIYGGTADAARRLAEMLRSEGVKEVTVADLCADDQSEAIAQAFRLSAMVVASPTYDGGLYPAMHDFLHHLALKNYRNRRVGLIENGSWAPMAARLMRKMLEPMPGVEIVEPVVTIVSRATAATDAELAVLAKAIANNI